MNNEKILNAEDRRLKALKNKEIENLKSLLSSDITYIHSNGKVDSKDDIIKKIETSFSYESLERGPLHIRKISESVAVVTGTLNVVFITEGGTEPQQLSTMVTQVWEETDDVVKLTAYHVSKINQ